MMNEKIKAEKNVLRLAFLDARKVDHLIVHGGGCKQACCCSIVANAQFVEV